MTSYTMSLAVILLLAATADVHAQEALSGWMSGVATNYGGSSEGDNDQTATYGLSSVSFPQHWSCSCNATVFVIRIGASTRLCPLQQSVQYLYILCAVCICVQHFCLCILVQPCMCSSCLLFVAPKSTHCNHACLQTLHVHTDILAQSPPLSAICSHALCKL